MMLEVKAALICSKYTRLTTLPSMSMTFVNTVDVKLLMLCQIFWTQFEQIHCNWVKLTTLCLCAAQIGS